MKTKFISTLIAGVLLSGAAMANPVEISRSITDIAAGADRHDWKRVRGAFADNVTVDYTSLWGGSPANALVSGSSVSTARVSTHASRGHHVRFLLGDTMHTSIRLLR